MTDCDSVCEAGNPFVPFAQVWPGSGLVMPSVKLDVAVPHVSEYGWLIPETVRVLPVAPNPEDDRAVRPRVSDKLKAAPVYVTVILFPLRSSMIGPCVPANL